MRIFRRTRGIIVIAAAVAIGGGIASAAIPDAGGVVHGCYDKNTGVLRVTDTQTNVPKGCTVKEAALSWNQQGPKGDPGPSDGYEGYIFGDVPAGGSQVTLNGSAKNIQPGSYLISGALSWNNLPSGVADIECFLDTTGATASSMAGRGLAWTWSGGSMALDGWMTIDPGDTGTLGVSCDEKSGNAAVLVHARVHAIRVGTLHGS